MVRDLIRRQEGSEEVFDPPQAHTHGEGDRREPALRGLVAADQCLRLAPQLGDLLAEPLVLLAEVGHNFGVGLDCEAALDLAGVLVDGLAAALGLFGLPCHVAVLTREDGGGVEDPGTNG
jgi:hypothetical protein